MKHLMNLLKNTVLSSTVSVRTQGWPWVALTQAGMVPRSNMAYPQVLMPKFMVKIPKMFSMKPAFTWRTKHIRSAQAQDGYLPLTTL